MNFVSIAFSPTSIPAIIVFGWLCTHVKKFPKIGKSLTKAARWAKEQVAEAKSSSFCGVFVPVLSCGVSWQTTQKCGLWD
jgi:hypothetical protein